MCPDFTDTLYNDNTDAHIRFWFLSQWFDYLMIPINLLWYNLIYNAVIWRLTTPLNLLWYYLILKARYRTAPINILVLIRLFVDWSESDRISFDTIAIHKALILLFDNTTEPTTIRFWIISQWFDSWSYPWICSNTILKAIVRIVWIIHK